MQQELLDIALALMMRKEQDPLYFYEPNPKQLEFHEAVADRVFLLAGNGLGKTVALDTEIALAMTGRHWIAGKWSPPPVSLRLGTEVDAVEEHIGNLRKLLGRHLAPGFPKKKGKQYERIWKLQNGSELDIMIYGQDDKRWESVSRDGVFFDEPFRESIWKATGARMRRGKGGMIVAAMTLLAGSAWIADKIVEAQDEKDGAISYKVIEGDSWANCRCLTPEEHGEDCRCNGGFVHKVAILKMMADWSEEERDARMYGHSIRVRDRAVPNFEPNYHVLPEDISPLRAKELGLRLYSIADPHRRRPPAWGIHGYDKDGCLYVLDEFPNIYHGKYKSIQSTKPYYYSELKDYKENYEWTVLAFKEIEDMWCDNGANSIVARFMDPRGAADRLANTNQSVLEAYNSAARDYCRDRLNHGSDCKCGSFDMRFHKAIVGEDAGEREITSGLLLIKNALACDSDWRETGVHPPMMFVNPRCANHIRALNFCRYKQNSGIGSDGASVNEVLEDKFKDFIDILRYSFKSVRNRKIEPKSEERKAGYVYRPLNSRTGY